MLLHVRDSVNNQGKSYFSVTNVPGIFNCPILVKLYKCLMIAAFNYVFRFPGLCLS